MRHKFENLAEKVLVVKQDVSGLFAPWCAVLQLCRGTTQKCRAIEEAKKKESENY